MQTQQQSEREYEITPPPRKSSLKKTAERRVHFNLPPAAPHQSGSRTERIAAEERERGKERDWQRERERDRDRERQRERERDIYQKTSCRRPLHPTTPSPSPPRRSSSSGRYSEKMYNAKKDYNTSTSSYITYAYDAHHHTATTTTTYTVPTSPGTRSLFPNQTPLPTYPTVYLITYATSLLTPLSSLLASQLPLRSPPIPHLYTIDARSMQPPSPDLCAAYSGISPLIQNIVMQDPGAMRAAREAVETLLAFGEARGRGRVGGGSGSMEVCLSVCCHAGTHRSVAIAERIAQCVKSEVRRLGCEDGVRVVCRHVHRVKGKCDPF